MNPRILEYKKKLKFIVAIFYNDAYNAKCFYSFEYSA